MSSPRLRRLAADYAALRAEFSGHPAVRVQPVGQLPPERYVVDYQIPGLVLNGNTPQHSEQHRVEIQLPAGYPREQPYCVPLTPIFHPNVSSHYCINDYWAAGEPLADVITKIGAMIQYQIYNTKSPLDATAAYWAAQHPDLFPIGHVNFGMPEPQIEVSDDLDIQIKGAD